MATGNKGLLDGAKRIAGSFRDLAIGGGVPGAPLGYRLRGATASGPPLTGTWLAGDQVPDRTGVTWTCTAGGNGTAATWAGTYPDQAPALEHALTGVTGITAFHAAVAARNITRLDVAVIGDSMTQGQGATSYGAIWVQQLNRAFRSAFPTVANGASGGLGFIPIQNALDSSTGNGVNTFTWPVTSTGTPGTADLGPVRYCTDTTSAAAWTWTAPAGTTSVRVMYYDVGSGGSFTWKVGSGSTTTVTGTATSTDLLTSSITISGGQVLTLAWVSGTVALDGIVHYAGDEASGVTFHACGHYGWNISATSPDGWNQPESFTLDWLQAYGAFPDLGAIIICLGANDQGAWTGPQFQANYQAFTADLRIEARLGTNIPIIPVIQYACGITPADPGGWPAYARAIRGAATATGITRVVDVNYRMPPVSSGFMGGELWLNGDSVGHPSNIGHALFGEIVAAGLAIA